MFARRKYPSKRGTSLYSMKTKKYLMHLQLCLLMFFIMIDQTNAMKCYKCTVTTEAYKINNTNKIISRTCSKFDESEDYIVECPYSTMCVKTISTLYLQNSEKLETVERGCAQQKDTTQVYRANSWHTEHTVLEVFEETCKESTLDGNTKTHCYCRGDLCNKATGLAKLNKAVLLIPVIIMYHALMTRIWGFLTLF